MQKQGIFNEIFVLDERGLQAIIRFSSSNKFKIRIPFSDDEIVKGSALSAYLLKLSSNSSVRPFIKVKDRYLFYVNDYILVGILKDVSEEKIRIGLAYLNKLNAFLVRNNSPRDMDSLINYLMKFLKLVHSNA